MHQCLLELQRRCRNFLKVTALSQSGDRIQASRANGDAWTPITGGCSSNSLRWLVKQSKHFGTLQAALDWIQERKETIANAPFGDNRKCKHKALVVAEFKQHSTLLHCVLMPYRCHILSFRHIKWGSNFKNMHLISELIIFTYFKPEAPCTIVMRKLFQMMELKICRSRFTYRMFEK